MIIEFRGPDSYSALTNTGLPLDISFDKRSSLRYEHRYNFFVDNKYMNLI
jgi:hypothetical protein